MAKSLKWIFFFEQGNRTSPLILLESVMNAEVKNWSSALEASAGLSLKASYYNSVLALWEPLLEPVDCIRNGSHCQRPWELTLTVKRNNPSALPPKTPTTPKALEDYEMQNVIEDSKNLEVNSSPPIHNDSIQPDPT